MKEFLFMISEIQTRVLHFRGSQHESDLSSADQTGEEGFNKKIIDYCGVFITQITHSNPQKDGDKWMGERRQCLNHTQRTNQGPLRVGVIVFPRKKHSIGYPITNGQP